MALGHFAPRQRRIGCGIAADEKEGRLDAFVGQRIEHPRRRRRPGSIVEGQHHFMVGERQSLRIGLNPTAKPPAVESDSVRSVPSLSDPTGRRGGAGTGEKNEKQSAGAKSPRQDLQH